MALTREEKVDRMVEQVTDWDIDALVDYAQENLEEYYGDLSDDEINIEYINWGLDDEDEDENDKKGDDYEPCPSVKPAKKEEEECPVCKHMKDVGDKCWCCGN